MWGILFVCDVVCLVSGITPTYVGNTTRPTASTTKDEDHPHVCGEYTVVSILKTPSLGSPPRMWGIHYRKVGAKKAIRITPTYVGNTVPINTVWRGIEDHPHVCGEY